jgi:hypothetical protein
MIGEHLGFDPTGSGRIVFVSFVGFEGQKTPDFSEVDPFLR